MFIYEYLLTKEKTVPGALNVLDPNAVYDESFFDKYYIPRTNSPLEDIIADITIRKNPPKILFSGHTGSGKTTELRQIKLELEKKDFLIIFVRANKEKLIRVDLHHTDILLAIMRSTIEIMGHTKIELNKNTIKKLEDVLKELVGEKKSYTINKSKKYWKIGGFFKIIGASLTGDKEIRTELRRNANTLQSEIIELFNELVNEYQEKSGKKLVVIVDDLEKLTDQKRILDFFHEHSRIITSLNCPIILTMPPSLKYSHDLDLISRFFDEIYFLPVFEVRKKDSSLNKNEILEMMDIIYKRVEKTVIPEDVLQTAIVWSGGLITDLLKILMGGCKKSYKKNETIVSMKSLTESFTDLTMLYKYKTGEMKMKFLRTIHETKTARPSKLLSELLCSLAVLEYNPPKENSWYDIHPAVEKLIH